MRRTATTIAAVDTWTWMLARLGCFLLLPLCALATRPAEAQVAIAFGGPGNERGYDAAVDGAGNVYVVGYFENSVDFDPDPSGTQTRTSNGGSDVFVASFDANGNYRWAFSLGDTNDDRGFGITVDDASNVYVTGDFQGTVDFDPDPAGKANRTSNGARDVFVASYDTNGNYRWAATFGAGAEDYGYGIVVDGSGNLFVSGGFSETVDFDPDPAATENRTSAGPWDVFLASFDANGNFRWVNAFGSTGDDEAYGVAIDGSGNLYVVGFFQGTVDFDPDPAGTANHASIGGYDVFLTSYDASGSHRWTHTLGGTDNDFSISVAVDGSDNVYLTGFFRGTVDFDPDPAGTANHASVGASDIFVASYDASGAYRWAHTFGAAGVDEGHGITVGSTGLVYVTGSFQGTVDFDPSPVIAENRTSNGGGDLFLVSLDTEGNYRWAVAAGSAGADAGIGLTTDASGNAFLTGFFQGTVDFDPDPAGQINHTSLGGTDVFIASYTPTGIVLPVELTHFGAVRDGDAVLLQWETASETNNAGFEVQHRPASEPDFRVLGFVEGRGTTLDAQRYQFRTSDLAPGRHLFRLKQVDYDGTFEYSAAVEVTVGLVEQFVLEAAFPNPFNPQTTLRFAVREAVPVRAVLYNALGQPVRVLYEGTPEAGSLHELRVDGSALPSGTYFVRLAGEGIVTTQQVVLLK